MSIGRPYVGAAIILVTAVAIASAAPTANSKGWPIRQDGDLAAIETPHYRVRTDLGVEVADLIAQQQEALFASLLQRMGTMKPAFATTARMDIVAVKTKEKFEEIRGKDAKGTPGAMYSPAPSTLAVTAAATELDGTLATLRQDGARQFTLFYLGGKSPTWLHEGFVSLFRNGQSRGGQIVTGQVPAATLAALKQAVADKKFIPVGEFVTMPNEDWAATVKAKGMGAAILYHEAWLLVHYLDGAEGGKYRPALVQYMAQVSRGTASAQAWGQAFGSPPAGFDARVRDYVAALKPTEALGCRANLLMLAMLAVKSHGAAKDIKALQEFGLSGGLADMTSTAGDGTKLEFKDPDLAKLVFRCPEDTANGNATSYELVPGKEGEPMIVRCRHHQGYTLETIYTKDDRGLITPGVVSKLTSATKTLIVPPAPGGTKP
jgi:hypothetical protein